MFLVVISLFSFLPVIFIFVFADQKSAMQSLVGAIVLTFSFTGLFASQSVYFNKQWFRFQGMLVASKVSPASYAVGLSVSGLVVALPGVLVALVLLLLSGPAPAFGILVALATSLLLWIGLVFVGFAIGATTKNARRANSIPQVLSIALGFLPPVYYPLSKLDAYPAAQAFAMLIPTTHAAQLAKYYFGLVDIPGWQVASDGPTCSASPRSWASSRPDGRIGSTRSPSSGPDRPRTRIRLSDPSSPRARGGGPARHSAGERPTR